MFGRILQVLLSHAWQESLANAKVNARQHCVSLSCLCNSLTQIEWVADFSLAGEHCGVKALCWPGHGWVCLAADCGSKVRSFVRAMGAATSAAPPSVIASQFATSEIVKRRWSWIYSCKRCYSKYTTFTFTFIAYMLSRVKTEKYRREMQILVLSVTEKDSAWHLTDLACFDLSL